jgi:hypothetical protein
MGMKRDPQTPDGRSGQIAFIGCLVNHNCHPSPLFFISVAFNGLKVYVSGLESTLASISISVDSKGTYVAQKLCNSLICL